MTSYQVIAPLVISRTPAGVDVYNYRGAILPADTSRDAIKHFLTARLVAPVELVELVEPIGAESPVVPATGEPVTPDVVLTPQRPAKVANKDEWVAYAVSQGANPDEAAALTKDELHAKYGA